MSMLTPQKLIQVCQNFCSKYNFKTGLSLNLKEIKNRNFVRLYCEIAGAYGVKEREISKLKELLSVLIEEIHNWDDLIDERRLPIRMARQITFSVTPEEEEKMSKEFNIDYELITDMITSDLNEKKKNILLQRLALDRKSYEEIREKALRINKREFLAVKELGLNFKQYLEEGEENLDTIEKFFRDEEAAKKQQKEPNRKNVIDMLKRGNCDFYLYNHVFYNFLRGKEISEALIESLDFFLKEYLVIDLLLDHIADLEQDIKYNSFNFLLWKNKEIEPKMKITVNNFHKSFIKNRIYDFFLDIGKEFAMRTKVELKKIKDRNLKDLLKLYLEGELEGLEIFKNFDYLISVPKEKREKVKSLILKPHPWENYNFKEVFKSK